MPSTFSVTFGVLFATIFFVARSAPIAQSLNNNPSLNSQSLDVAAVGAPDRTTAGMGQSGINKYATGMGAPSMQTPASPPGGYSSGVAPASTPSKSSSGMNLGGGGYSEAPSSTKFPSGSNLTPADSLTPTIGGVKYSPQVNGTASSQGMNGVGYSAVSSTGGPGLISNGTSNPSETYTHANLAERLPSLGPGSFVGAVLISLLFA